MNQYQIKQFLTIAKHLNLSTAAQELYITQPALSIALGRLENEIGMPLFYRERGKLRFSDAGVALMPEFQKIISAFDGLEKKIEELKYREDEHIMLGFSGSTYMYTSLFMTQFLEVFDNISINKICGDPHGMEDMLSKGQLDFMITQYPIKNTELESTELLTEELGLAVASGHPLAGETSICFKDIAHLKLMGFERAQFFRKLCDRLCKNHGFLPEYTTEYNYRTYVEVIRQNAGLGKFVSFTPVDNFETTYGKHGSGYRLVRIVEPQIYRQTRLAWNMNNSSKYRYKGFVDYVKEHYGEQNVYYKKFLKFTELQGLFGE